MRWPRSGHQGPDRGGSQGWKCNHHFGGLRSTRVWPESPVLWDQARWPGCAYPERGFLRAPLHDTGGKLRHEAAASVAWKSLLPYTLELLPLTHCSFIRNTRLQSSLDLAAEATSSSFVLKYSHSCSFFHKRPQSWLHTQLSPLLAMIFAFTFSLPYIWPK